MLQNSLKTLQFHLRQNYLGKLRLRPGLPRIQISDSECHYYRKVLQTAPDLSFMTHLIDIGCRNWSYAPALAAFFPLATLLGLEVDGGRRYWNLFRRADLAKAFAKHLRLQGRKAEFQPIDFRGLQRIPETSGMKEPRVLFTFFFPFVSENPCLKWGLPTEYADFSKLLNHTQKLASPRKIQAWVISTHQGTWELEEAKKAYAGTGIPFKETVLGANETLKTWPSPFDTHILVGQIPKAI